MSNKPYTSRDPRKYIGSYSPKFDAKEKTLGKTQFFDDKTLKGKLPGMLYCKILNSPFANATITSMDTSKAESYPGVHYVLRYDDPEIRALKITTHAWTDTSITPYSKDVIDRYWDRCFLENRARWVGDQMGVAIAAETAEIAEQALALVDIKWEVHDFVLEVDDAKKEKAPILHPRLNPNSNALIFKGGYVDGLSFDKGNVDDGMKEADFIMEIDRTYGGNSVSGTLDYRGCAIYWDDEDLTCWTNHYCYDQNRLYLHEHLGVPLNHIRVYNGNSGASMGKWNTGEDIFFIITAFLSKRSGRPVKYKMTNHEEFHESRSENRFEVKAGIRNDGKITALDIVATGNSGGYMNGCDQNVELQLKQSMERMLSPIENVRIHSHVYFTSRMPGAIVRAVANIQHCYTFMYLMDEIAERLGLDPIEVIMKNGGHTWSTQPDESLKAVLEKGAEKIGWTKRHKAGEGPLIDGCKKKGIGVSAWNSWHPEWLENDRGHVEVSIRINPDLSVYLQAQTSETGAGGNHVAVLACADSLSFLNIRPQDINLATQGDSHMGLRDSPPTGSVVSFLYAEAIHEAGAKVKRSICERAGYFMKIDPDDLDIEDAVIFQKSNPTNRIGVSDMMINNDCVPIYTHHARNNDRSGKGVAYAAWFAEVEVDIELGNVEVKNLVLVNDAGKVLHASGAESQQLGGQCMGFGESLMEEIVYDKNTGTMLNHNYIDYKMPTIMEFAPINAELLEVWKGGGEYGATGFAEGTLTGTPMAIGNAIYNAIGVRIDKVPYKPESILNALAKRKGTQQ